MALKVLGWLHDRIEPSLFTPPQILFDRGCPLRLRAVVTSGTYREGAPAEHLGASLPIPHHQPPLPIPYTSRRNGPKLFSEDRAREEVENFTL